MAKPHATDNLESGSNIIQMMILTAGAYSLYWFWQSWATAKEALGLKVSPGWRAVFINFTVHTLARDINWLLDRVKRKPNLQPYPLLMAMWICVILSMYGVEPTKGQRNYWFLLVSAFLTICLTTAVMIVMQQSLNRYLHKAPLEKPVQRNNIIVLITIVSAISGWITLLIYLFAAISGSDPIGTSNLLMY